MTDRSTIDRIRDRIDLVAYIGETVKLQRRGRSFLGLCPFHREKTPSFTVSEERGLFHCFGCKVSGDIFKFIELTEGLSFGEALQKLAERAGVELNEDESLHDRKAEQRARKSKEDLYAINSIAAAFFTQMMLEHPLAKQAQEELLRRGLPTLGDGSEGEAILRSFYVGYAPASWDALANHLKQHGISPVQAEQLGLLAARSGSSGYYDTFRHRLMVGIVDVQGRIVAFSGRTLPSPAHSSLKQDDFANAPKYVNSRESAIYTKGSTLFGLFQARNAIRAEGSVVLVEGNFDLIAMHVRGFANVVAPMGTAFTIEQAKLVKRFSKDLILLFDADSAGQKATWAARPICKEVGLSVQVARLSQGKDPDEFLQLRGAEAMHEMLKTSRSLDEVLLDDLCNYVGEGSNLNQKKSALEKMRPILDDQDPAFRNILAKRIAARLGLDLAGFWRGVRGGASTYKEQPSTSVQTTRDEELLSQAIVESILMAPELLEDPTIQPSLALITGDWAFVLVALQNETRKARQNNLSLNWASVLAQIPSSIQERAAAKFVEAAYANESNQSDPTMNARVEFESPVDLAALRRVIRENSLKLEKVIVAARSQELEREILHAEERGDFEQAMALALEKNQLGLALLQANANLRELL